MHGRNYCDRKIEFLSCRRRLHSSKGKRSVWSKRAAKIVPQPLVSGLKKVQQIAYRSGTPCLSCFSAHSCNILLQGGISSRKLVVCDSTSQRILHFQHSLYNLHHLLCTSMR
ncbi:hypothetical protein Mapa_013631 [Marchantia paleacea]|nr:hypothetical protein Mapa_013631 [Marchantia paleacea]